MSDNTARSIPPYPQRPAWLARFLARKARLMDALEDEHERFPYGRGGGVVSATTTGPVEIPSPAPIPPPGRQRPALK